MPPDEPRAVAAARSRRARMLLAGGVAVTVVAGLALAAILAPAQRDPPAAGPAALERCAELGQGPAARACFGDALSARVVPARDPTSELRRVDVEMRRLGSYPASNCHVIMHTVGRRYARAHAVSIERLMDHLPRTNDPGCAAGFAHGIITAIAPTIMREGPRAAEAACAQNATRYQRYSCVHGMGHAYMRFYDEALAPALRLCRTLGDDAAPDCAQGAYHDYCWRSPGRTARSGRRAPRRTSARSATASRPTSCCRAGTGRSSTPGQPATRPRRRRTWSGSAARRAACSAAAASRRRR